MSDMETLIAFTYCIMYNQQVIIYLINVIIIFPLCFNPSLKKTKQIFTDH